MIEEKLHNAIMDFSMQYGKNGTIILMHPKTYHEFEVKIKDYIKKVGATFSISDTNKTIVFKGYEIFRTTDIERNEFRVV